MWTYSPTLRKFAAYVLLWPMRRAWSRGSFRPELGYQPSRQDLVDSIVAAASQLMGATAAFAILYWATGAILDSVVVRLLVAVAAVFALGAVGIPAISLLSSVVGFAVTAGVILIMLVLGNWARLFTFKKDASLDDALHALERLKTQGDPPVAAPAARGAGRGDAEACGCGWAALPEEARRQGRTCGGRGEERRRGLRGNGNGTLHNDRRSPTNFTPRHGRTAYHCDGWRPMLLRIGGSRPGTDELSERRWD